MAKPKKGEGPGPQPSGEGMRVMGSGKLTDFKKVHPDAGGPLEAWLDLVERMRWRKFADVRAVYPHADLVGRLTVFNIGGNKYRLIASIDYGDGLVLVRHVLTHAEYDRGRWKESG